MVRDVAGLRSPAFQSSIIMLVTLINDTFMHDFNDAMNGRDIREVM